MANMFPVSPAPHQDNTRPNQQHRPNVVFGPRGPAYNYRFGPKAHDPIASALHKVGNTIGEGLHWAFPHNPAAHFGAQMKQTGREAVQMFDPRHREGLVNILSMFAGGPKSEDVLAKWQPAGHFEPYSALHGNPLDRGIAREGTQFANPADPGMMAARVGQRLRAQSSIGRIVGRAKGVGGYQTPRDPLTEIELSNIERQKLAQSRDKMKEYSNRSGFAMKNAREVTNNTMKVEKAMGGAFVPMQGRFNPDFPTNSMEAIPRSYRNGLAAYNDGNGALLDMLREMLFGGYPYKRP